MRQTNNWKCTLLTSPFLWLVILLSPLCFLQSGCKTAEIQVKAPATGNQHSTKITLDRKGNYLILATKKASNEYVEALAIARKLHPEAEQGILIPGAPASMLDLLKKHQPRYVLIFITPGELDVNFAWQWLTTSTRVDDDPFTDFRYGIITGQTPEAAANFMQRVEDSLDGKLQPGPAVVDNLGPNTMMKKNGFQKNMGSFLLPLYAEKFSLFTISHGAAGFTDKHLDSMNRAGILHFGGHGYPDRIVDGLNSAQVSQLKLSPCTVFNGACYSGVTGRWFEIFTPDGKVKENHVKRDQSFCLAILNNNCIAYLAALHPDHGIPVYQEMEYLACTGAPLGAVMKYTYDGVVVGAAGSLPALEPFSGGMASPQMTPSEIVLKGTASRVLFGDPALIIFGAFTGPPFKYTLIKQDDKTLSVKAQLTNTKLKSTFTDTYHADLAADKMQFNDRALLVFELPDGWEDVSDVKVVSVSSHEKKISHRLVGYAVEQDEGKSRLHLQVDVAANGYMQSELRNKGAAVELLIKK